MNSLMTLRSCRSYITRLSLLTLMAFCCMNRMAVAQTPAATPFQTATPIPTATAWPIVTPAPLPSPTPALGDLRAQAGNAAEPLTLTDAIATALRNNPQRLVAVSAFQAASSRIRSARSAGGPQVNLTGNSTNQRGFGGPSTAATPVATPNATPNATPGTDTNNLARGLGQSGLNSTFGFNASLPIYTGGRVNASTRVAEANARALAAQLLQIEQDLILNVAQSYLSILRSHQLLAVADSNLAVSRERLRVAQVRFNAGAAARLEVLRAQTTLSDGEQRRVAASNTLAQNTANLNTLMGRVPETPITIRSLSSLKLNLPIPTQSVPPPSIPIRQPTFPRGGDGAMAATGPNDTTGTASTTTAAAGSTANASPGASVVKASASGAEAASVSDPKSAAPAQLRDLAGQSRPSLEVVDEQLRSAEANVDLAKAQRKPSLDLNLGALLRNPATFLGRFTLSLGVALGQTIFDSGRIKAQIAEARALAEQARGNRQQEQLNVANQIEQSLLAIDSAQGRLQSAEVAVTAADEALRAAQLGYEAGVTTALEVNDAQVALLTTQTDAVNARFDIATAQSALAGAVGVLSEEAQTAYQDVLNSTPQAELQKVKNSDIKQVGNPGAPAEPPKKRRKFLGIF